MSARAVATGSINLGQGFPDRDGPAAVARAAADAILAGRGNQYPPGPGVPELRRAIAAHDERFWGLRYDPDSEILVTAGATEAVAAAMLALVEPGDEVIAFEPYYDSYAANIAMAGGVRVPVTLRPPDFRPDLDELAQAVTDRTRLILLNTPHNPSGSVFTRDELAAIVASSSRVNTVPVGLCGVLSRMSLVRSVIARASSPRSGRKSGGRSVTGTRTPPAMAMLAA